MTTIINGSSPSITFSDSTTQSSGVNTVNPVFTGDASISGLTVGKGGGASGFNTAVGAGVLAANTTGVANTVVGSTNGANAALSSNTTGNGNNAFGAGALGKNTTAAQNNAFGYEALRENTTGANNVAVGGQALLSNTTASNNTAVGYQAGYSNTTGSENTALGHRALETNATGGDNVAIGRLALAAATGSANTAIGEASGFSITTGAKNTILGRYNGNQGGLDIRTANNHIVLSDGDGNPRQIINSSGFTKISNNAGWQQTNTFHEIIQTSADTTLIVTNTSTNPFGLVLKYANAAINANSNAYLTCEDNSGGGRVMLRIWSNGNVQNLNNSYGSLSDQSVKENIVDATPKLSDLMNVKVRNFNLIGDETKQIGVVAQELETIFPKMVEEDEDGIKGVKYSVFVPMLIKAVQELNAKLEAQALEIAQLKGN